jgi:hypothetical protein
MQFVFYANTGIYDLVIGDLGLSNYFTVDGRLCPPVASALGIDILNKFDFSFSDSLETLFLKRSGGGCSTMFGKRSVCLQYYVKL